MSKLALLAVTTGLGVALGVVGLTTSRVAADTPVAASGTYDQSDEKDKDKKKKGAPKGSTKGSYSGE